MRKVNYFTFLFMDLKYDDAYDKFLKNMIAHKSECKAYIDDYSCATEIRIDWHNCTYVFSLGDYDTYLSCCRCYTPGLKNPELHGIIRRVRASRRTTLDFYLAFVKSELERLENLDLEKRIKETQFIIDGANYD